MLDERFASRAGRQRCKKEVNALLKAVFRTRSLADWERAFEALDLPFSPVLGAWELFADPHVMARNMVREMPEEGAIALRFPVKFSLGLPDSAEDVPSLGEQEPEGDARRPRGGACPRPTSATSHQPSPTTA